MCSLIPDALPQASGSSKGKGKRRKMAKEEFTDVRLVAILPDGLNVSNSIVLFLTTSDFLFQDDRTLKNIIEPNPQQIDELIRLGYATIGNRGEHKFGNDWDTDRLDDWLCDMLPAPFEQIHELLNPSEALDHPHLW
jgi:hypothetical protein